MRIVINGFGGISVIFLRTILTKPGVEIIAINDITDTPDETRDSSRLADLAEKISLLP